MNYIIKDSQVETTEYYMFIMIFILKQQMLELFFIKYFFILKRKL